MSWMPATEPACERCESSAGVKFVIEARSRQIDGFAVRRVLPSMARRTVGPFIFFDHMGPAVFAAGEGLDVRPHPHLHLATVTYLFDGEIVHRDSLGSVQPIRPGDINWMTAGRGIVHSERTGAELRKTGSRLHGIQVWIALPRAQEDTDPDFRHHRAGSLPLFREGGANVRLLAGEAYGRSSPVRVFSPMFYAEAILLPEVELKLPDEHPERALYVVEGAVHCGGRRFEASNLLVFAEGARALVRSEGSTRLMLLGGAPLDGPRHIWWNFVSSSKDRIERAKRDWKEGRFPKVPGDEVEFIPLPEQ